MKYIKKENYLINIEKCVHIQTYEYQSGDCALCFQNENGNMYFKCESKEEMYKDMERIEEFITNEERLLRL